MYIHWTGVAGRRGSAQVLALLLLLPGCGLSAAAPAGTPVEPPRLTAVWAGHGEDKVAQEELRASADPQSVLSSLWDGRTISLFGARGEVVAFTLILEAAAGAASRISVSFPGLAGPGGFRILSPPWNGDPETFFDWTARPIELFYIRYLQIQGLSRPGYETYDERHVPERLRRPFTGEGYGYGTWGDRPDHDRHYPEIAVPLELHPTFAVPAGRSQCLWVDVYIPAGAPAGDYQGAVTVREGDARRYLPVRLTVRGFLLPDAPAAQTMVFLGGTDLEARYGALTDQLVDRHFQLAHRHRLSLIDAGFNTADRPPAAWEPRLDGSLFTADHGYGGPGAGAGNGVYAIGTYSSWWWMWDPYAMLAMWAHTDAWEGWFQIHAPETARFLYLVDESGNYPEIEQWAAWMTANPGVGALLPSFATIWAPTALVETPSLRIAASTITVGDTDEWEATVAAYAADSEKWLYLYNGRRPASGSFATEDDGVALRELAWGQYKKGIDRWFYWESTYYNNYQGGTGQTNVFQQAQTFGGQSGFDEVLGETGWMYGNGDGVLFYPGTDLVYPEESYGISGPIASLRLKLWRRGLQDVDYLTLAARWELAQVQAIVKAIVPKALWEYGVDDPGDPTWVRTDISWSTDPGVWEAARAQLAAIIESHQPSACRRPKQHLPGGGAGP